MKSEKLFVNGRTAIRQTIVRLVLLTTVYKQTKIYKSIIINKYSFGLSSKNKK